MKVRLDMHRIFENVSQYIICSTLNQMVNYIPLRVILDNNMYTNKNFLQILNLTKKYNNNSSKEAVHNNRERFSNQDWDANFLKVLHSDTNRSEIYRCCNIELELDNGNFEESVKACFEKNKSLRNNENQSGRIKRIWNVTGGQKNLLFKVIQWLVQHKESHKEDVVIYLEGNTGNIFYATAESNFMGFQKENMDYYPYGIKLTEILHLSGYKWESENKDIPEPCNYLDEVSSKDNQGVVKDNELKDLNLYKNVYEKIRNVINGNVNEFKTKKEKLDFAIDLLKMNKDEIGVDKLKDYGIDDDTVVKIEHHLSKRNVNKGGYLLEYVALYAVREAVQEINKKSRFFTGLYHSVNIDREDSEVTYTKKLCEFDIVLTTACGQPVIFECKSGAKVSADSLKGRVYTSYATAGVYGKPILLTGLNREGLKYLLELETKDKEKGEHHPIVATYRAALRSNIAIWGLNEIKERLEQLFQYSYLAGGSDRDDIN